MSPQTTAIVPTLGHSPWLGRCLDALRRAGGGDVEILLVAQGAEGRRAGRECAESAGRVIELEANLGFAAANNRGLDAARGEFVATVNDDVVVDEDWYRHLVEALGHEPRAAAVQGVNLRLDDPRLADGCGLAWNGWWQAVQIGHGEPAPDASVAPREVFGVSATAALYRRAALPRPMFDERLFAYYEDVDLACRLRAAGHGALLVPAARADHAGSVSGRRLALGGRPLIYGNRYLVLARLLGRAFAGQLPRVVARDVLDLGWAVWRAELGRVAGIAAGWGRAVRHLGRYAHAGKPALPVPVLRSIE